MTTLRLPLRLARREVWRRPGRTALVALLVALPVAGMTASVVLLRTDRISPLERWELENGLADAELRDDPGLFPTGGAVPVVPPTAATAGGEGPSTVTVDPATVLPPGSRVVDVAFRYQRLRSDAGRRADLDLRDMPLDDPLTSGVVTLVSGRAPVGNNEIALSARAGRRLQVASGDSVEVRGADRRLEVVGVFERSGCLSCVSGLVAPGHLKEGLDAGSGWNVGLVDLPDDLSSADRAALAEQLDGRLILREEATDPALNADNQESDAIRWSLVLGALVLTVAGIVISAAFAVGARRQLVTLGQLAASGVSPSTIRSALVLQGTVTGVIGAAFGLVIAAVGLGAGHGLVERILDQRVHGYTVRLLDVFLAVAIGIGAATVAALIPARSTARIPTLAALSGRRPLTPVPARMITWAVVSMAGGLGLLALAVVGSQSGSSGELWAYVAILGGAGELLGACALAPAIVARLEPLAARLRGPWRLGARSLARHRSRTGAVVSAVAAAGALAIASGALLQGAQAREQRGPQFPNDVVLARVVTYDDATGVERSAPPSAIVRAAMSDALGDATEVNVQMATTGRADGADIPKMWSWEAEQPNRPTAFVMGVPHALVADESLLDLMDAGKAVRSALADLGVVVVAFDQAAQPVDVVAPDGTSIPARLVPSTSSLGYDATILISPTRADELGLQQVPVAVAFQADHPLSELERQDVGDVILDLEEDSPSAASGYVEVRMHSPLSGPSLFAIELILTGVALAFSVFVVGVSLALAAAESREERDVLTIAGAPPATVARSAGARAWLLAGIGGAMAIPVGFLPVIVFTKAGDGPGWAMDYPLVFPGRTVLTLLVLVPICAALAAWAASATAQRLRPVRVSTVTFE